MQYSIAQILSKAVNKLQEIGINSPQLEARILLQYAINKSYEYILANPNTQLNQLKINAFEEVLARRLNHEPIAYIIGVKEFYSHEFIVNKYVLIPRAETELLVDVVIYCHSLKVLSHGSEKSLMSYRGLSTVSRKLTCGANNFSILSWIPLQARGMTTEEQIHAAIFSRERGNPERKQLDSVVKPRNDNFYILELGTGSGCIAVTLLLELPDSQVTALDISSDAIKVAKNNAIKHKVADRLKIVQSNWFENIKDQKFDFIVSNPPYISETEKPEMAVETINYEPHLALFAEENGLLSYRIIAENAKKFLKQNGKLALEIGYNQQEAVSKIFLDHGYNIKGVYKDLQGHSRVILLSPVSLNRSYARRIGKSLSGLQQNLLDTELPKYLFLNEKLINEKRQIFLEIGFGMGEHFINQAKMNPESLYIGAEVYLNGVANVLKLAQEQNITNFLLFPNNLDFILHNLPNNSLDGIYILFPDPWIKNKQKKKRILNKERLKILQNKLKKNGRLIFASDIEDYFNEVIKLISQNGKFKIMNETDYAEPHDNYIITKYHQKAIDAGRQAKFIVCTNISIR